MWTAHNSNFIRKKCTEGAVAIGCGGYTFVIVLNIQTLTYCAFKD